MSFFKGILGGHEKHRWPSKNKTEASGNVISERDSYEQAVLAKLLQSVRWPKEYPTEAIYRDKITKDVSKLLQDVFTTHRQKKRRLEDKISEYQKAMSDEEDEHSRRVQELEIRYTDHVHRIQTAHSTEITKMRQQGEEQRHGLEAQQTENIRKLQTNHDVTQKKLERDAARLRVNLDAAEREKEGVRKYHDAALQLMRDKTNEANEIHKAALASLKQGHAEEYSRLIQEQNYREESLVSNHKEEIQHFRSQVKELNAALLARDDELYTGKLFSTSGLPQMSDGKLRDNFSKITAAVDYLGRLEWRPNQLAWSEQDLDGIRGPHSIKRVKRAIVQDVIWCLLFDFVFASPFRMLGELGRTLEGQWAAQSGKDTRVDHDTYEWPPPSARRERWRYMTLAECREALTQPISGLDPRAQVKKGFSDSQEELTQSLKAAIESVAVLHTETSRKIEELSRLARITWLDFQMHRCRIVASLTGSGTRKPSQRSNEIRNGSVMLTISPELRRFGNIKGTDLDIPITITNCDGETLRLS